MTWPPPSVSGPNAAGCEDPRAARRGPHAVCIDQSQQPALGAACRQRATAERRSVRGEPLRSIQDDGVCRFNISALPCPTPPVRSSPSAPNIRSAKRVQLCSARAPCTIASRRGRPAGFAYRPTRLRAKHCAGKASPHASACSSRFGLTIPARHHRSVEAFHPPCHCPPSFKRTTRLAPDREPICLSDDLEEQQVDHTTSASPAQERDRCDADKLLAVPGLHARMQLVRPACMRRRASGVGRALSAPAEEGLRSV